MPSHEGIEVWIEDSKHQRLSDQNPTFNSVDADDRTISVKTEMLRDELYTVHCRSPMSVVCDVLVITAAGFRKSAARFYLDSSLATSEYATGSSVDHTLEQFKHGLRTPRRVFQGSTTSKLGTVEIEVRRIGEIIKDKSRKEYPDDKSDDEVEFIMIDRPDQPPWVIFRFDIDVKVTMPAKFKRRPRLMHRDRSLTVSAGSSNETSCKIGHDDLHNPKKHCREHDSHEESSSQGAGRGSSPRDTDLELLQQEYEKEEAEERRLLEKLQERLHAKRMRNTELRRLLGETNEA